MDARYETTIGLEVHAQLLTRTKIFCACEAVFGAPPNTAVCPTCLGLPGALPVLNREVVRMATAAALALSCRLRSVSRFARKNYFYPDLPKGYQISQYDEPLAEEGVLAISGTYSDKTPFSKTCRIVRVHLEEDAGKTLHGGAFGSVVDLNRAGTPLIEIVGAPDLTHPEEASAYLKALRQLLLFVGVSDGNLEEGSFRCDANISVRPKGQKEFGTRVELKNINSFRFVEKALQFEAARQREVLASGGAVRAETRGYDEGRAATFPMRAKEGEADYRYFPDPDLPPLVVPETMVEEVRRALPELPTEKRARYVSEFGISAGAAEVLTTHPRIAAFFEEVALLLGNGTHASNFVQSEVLRDVSPRGLACCFPVKARDVALLLRLVDKGTLSGKLAKEVYAEAKETLASPEEIVARRGLSQVSDEATLRAICAAILEEHPKQAADLREGKIGILGFFVGQVMKKTSGRANPPMVNRLLRALVGLSDGE